MSAGLGSVLFVVGIVAAITIHEWGHFVTARRFGMRAERFFFGFGPTIWSTRPGETEYGVKAFPLGGFVRIAGMATGDERLRPVPDAVFDPEEVANDRRVEAGDRNVDLEQVAAVPGRTWQRLEDELESRGVPGERRARIVSETRQRAPRDASARETAEILREVAERELPDTGRISDLRHRVLQGDRGRFFHDRPAWERAVVLFAGSGMHFAQAIVLLFVGFWAFGLQPVATVEQVLPETPAAEAGMQAGDRIVEVEGREVDRFETARGIIEAHPGEAITLVVQRDGQREQLTLTTALVVDTVEAGSALEDAGFQPGDRVVGLDGGGPPDVDAIRAAGDADGDVAVTVQRFVGSEDGTVTAERDQLQVPADAMDDLAAAVTGLAGFQPALGDYGPVEALRETFVGEASFPALFVGSVEAFGQLFSPAFISSIPDQIGGQERDPAGGASLVGLTQVAGEGAAIAGLFFLLGLLASLNVFIGIFNLVPLPPLDGGHLAVLAVERSVNAVRELRGRTPDYRVDPSTITAIAIPVIVLLGVMFISFVLLDIANPLRLPQ